MKCSLNAQLSGKEDMMEPSMMYQGSLELFSLTVMILKRCAPCSEVV